jgi:hypothetical protein
MSYKRQKLLTLREHMGASLIFGGVVCCSFVITASVVSNVYMIMGLVCTACLTILNNPTYDKSEITTEGIYSPIEFHNYTICLMLSKICV